MIEKRPEIPRKNIYLMDVPYIKQPTSTFCGYTSLAMVLQYYKYSEATPEKLYNHLHGEPRGELTKNDRDKRLAPSVDTLALMVQELTTDLQPKIFDKNIYNKLAEKGFTPHDVLQAHLKKNIPCLVRIPAHWIVAKGVDMTEGVYYFNDPAIMPIKDRSTMKIEAFERLWAKGEDAYPKRDTKYLMLAIAPRKTA